MQVEVKGSTWRGTKEKQEKLSGEEESSKGQNIANSNSKCKYKNTLNFFSQKGKVSSELNLLN
jgi:hypothetical protein